MLLRKQQIFQTMIVVAAVILLPCSAAGHEKFFQEKWCAEHHGRSEVMLSDKTRADCITATHAIEFDFGKKWAEAMGQSLYYSFQTGKRAGVVLILETPRDRKYFLRLNSTIDHFKLPIDTWEMSN